MYEKIDQNTKTLAPIVRNRKKIFLFINQNICCEYSKEPSQWDGSFEHPKHMLKIMGKKILTILCWIFFVYLNLWNTKGEQENMYLMASCCRHNLWYQLLSPNGRRGTLEFYHSLISNVSLSANRTKTAFCCNICALNVRSSKFGDFNRLVCHVYWRSLISAVSLVIIYSHRGSLLKKRICIFFPLIGKSHIYKGVGFILSVNIVIVLKSVNWMHKIGSSIAILATL